MTLNDHLHNRTRSQHRQLMNLQQQQPLPVSANSNCCPGYFLYPDTMLLSLISNEVISSGFCGTSCLSVIQIYLFPPEFFTIYRRLILQFKLTF